MTSAVVLSRPARSSEASTRRWAGVAAASSGVGTAQQFEELAVVEALGQPVGAEQKHVARLVGHGADLRIDELVAARRAPSAARCAADDRAPRAR